MVCDHGKSFNHYSVLQRRQIYKPVVAAVQQSLYCDELILVNDGSQRETELILKTISGVKLVRHVNNLGKSKAMLTGLKAAKNEIVCFIDADLTGFETRHFDSLVGKLINDSLDMTMSFRSREDFLGSFLEFSLIFSGERCFRSRSELLRMDLFEVKGYLIEPAINQFFLHRKKVAPVWFDGVGQVGKIRKEGFSGKLKDIKMGLEYLYFLGWREFVFEINLARKSVKSVKEK